MKKTILFIIVILLFSFNGCTYIKVEKKLKCTEEIKDLQNIIKDSFNADSVIIYTKIIKEELFFPELRSPVIAIFNPTTKSLDFKKLPTNHYRRFDNYAQIEQNLKFEGLKFAKLLTEKCYLYDYNDIIVEYLKGKNTDEGNYRFICHYEELLKQNKK